tara:strand:+ start:785 stop:1039 length:255 start_codon:yes stop_codon:yes gene_type:complete
MKFNLRVRETIEIDKSTRDFVKKIEYVIGAIKHEMATTGSSWDVRVGEVRIQKFHELLSRKVKEAIHLQFNKHVDDLSYEFTRV